MKLNIDLDELIDALEKSNEMRHFFIDTKEHELIYVNEEIEDNISEKLEKMEDDKYIALPDRTPQDDFSIMECFVYELSKNDFELAEKFYEALEKKNPFRNFKIMLEKYPIVKEKWFKYKYNAIKNEIINWLCENNIKLENQQLIPEIKIKELEENELRDLPEGIKDFGPVACLKCQNEEDIKARFFSINVAPENLLIERETRRIMKEKYGINHYGNFTGGEKEILTVAECPRCGNEEVFWDY